MIGEQQFPFLAEKGHVVSLVGGGGKTTLQYAMASHCVQKGWQGAGVHYHPHPAPGKLALGKD